MNHIELPTTGHTLVCGRTGCGRTSLLKYTASSEAKRGRRVYFISMEEHPHLLEPLQSDHVFLFDSDAFSQFPVDCTHSMKNSVIVLDGIQHLVTPESETLLERVTSLCNVASGVGSSLLVSLQTHRISDRTALSMFSDLWYLDRMSAECIRGDALGAKLTVKPWTKAYDATFSVGPV